MSHQSVSGLFPRQVAAAYFLLLFCLFLTLLVLPLSLFIFARPPVFLSVCLSFSRFADTALPVTRITWPHRLKTGTDPHGPCFPP